MFQWWVNSFSLQLACTKLHPQPLTLVLPGSGRLMTHSSAIWEECPHLTITTPEQQCHETCNINLTLQQKKELNRALPGTAAGFVPQRKRTAFLCLTATSRTATITCAHRLFTWLSFRGRTDLLDFTTAPSSYCLLWCLLFKEVISHRVIKC